jgi:hypothetical protein
MDFVSHFFFPAHGGLLLDLRLIPAPLKRSAR